MKTLQPNFYIPAVTSIIIMIQVWPALTLAGGQKVSAKRNLLALFLAQF